MAPSCQGPALQTLEQLWGSWQANSTAGWMQALRCVSFPCQHSWLNKVIYLLPEVGWTVCLIYLYYWLCGRTTLVRNVIVKCFLPQSCRLCAHAKCSLWCIFQQLPEPKRKNNCLDLSLIQVQGGWGSLSWPWWVCGGERVCRGSRSLKSQLWMGSRNTIYFAFLSLFPLSFPPPHPFLSHGKFTHSISWTFQQ